MKPGLLTAAFREAPLTVADWTIANGFESIEIAGWPRSAGPTRRYRGTVVHAATHANQIAEWRLTYS